jgi:glucokinase
MPVALCCQLDLKTADTGVMTQDVKIDSRLWLSAVPLACVDIGGTKVAVTVVDARGAHARLSEPTCKTGHNDALAQQVVRLVRQSCASVGLGLDDLAAVGVSSCGPFVVRGGLIELAAPNICGALAGSAGRLPNNWTSAPLEAPLLAAFKKVRIENDAIAALEAERRWGALRTGGQPLADCAYVTWSTGVGVGLCVDGHVLRGKNGNAGHAGHQFVSDNVDALCGCGNVGDVEALVGGVAIGQRHAGGGYTSAAALLQAAKTGGAEALQITDALCRVMGRMLYNLVATLDLQRISMGGSVFWNHREFLLPRLTAQLDGKLPALTGGCELVSAGLGQQVGDFAALALALALTDQGASAATSVATAPTRAS